MIRIVLDRRPGEKKYTLDIMNTRDGSKFNVTHVEGFTQVKADIEEALEKWRRK